MTMMTVIRITTRSNSDNDDDRNSWEVKLVNFEYV